jgi:hypothetical protein
MWPVAAVALALLALVVWWLGFREPSPLLVQDFEECAEQVQAKPLSNNERGALMTQCYARFAGRRKRGGGYTYYDFMQDRSFDIAGPNPTPEEQKYIDQHYALYLEKQRRNSIEAAISAKQQQEEIQEEQPQPLQPASLRTDTERVPIPQARPYKLIDGHPRCTRPHSFSCDWPRLSETIHDLKKIFGGSQAKDAKDTKGKKS